MKIVDSTLQLAASHSQTQQHVVSESLRLWRGERSTAAADTTSTNAQDTDTAPLGLVLISDAGRARQANDSGAVQNGTDAVDNDPTLGFIRRLLAILTGKDIEVFDTTALSRGSASTFNAGALTGFSGEYTSYESYSESEQTSFSATGTVKTADGKEIDFSLSLGMARSYHMESSTRLLWGNARQTTDPLVVNFSGQAAQLTDTRFAFDLNADGTASEQINFVAGGSGFLSFDRNGDGRINDGSELFGATSGNGFAELAELDSDGNGWIDENDAAYAQLSVWTRDATGTDRLRSLAEADVGAISVNRIATPFSIKDANNDLQAQVRASGVYLRESGGVGSVQQIDLTV